MDKEKVKLVLQIYLEAMQTLPPPDIGLMKILTLKELRLRAKTEDGKAITQIDLGKVLDRNRTTIGEWEAGRNLDGITTSHIVAMANLFGCRIEEVVAVIENTRILLTKEEN